MVAHLATEPWRLDGCSDACTRRLVIVPGLLGRQMIVQHDPASHEARGRVLAGEHAPDAVIQSGPLVYSAFEKRVFVSGAEVFLTRIEWGLFSALVKERGRLVPIEEVAMRVWGAPGANDAHCVRVHLARLRARLGVAAGLIETVQGLGYRFHLLPPGEIPPPPSPRWATMPERGQWALRYRSCRRCGTTERRHRAHGYCNPCYIRTRAFERGADKIERGERRTS